MVRIERAETYGDGKMNMRITLVSTDAKPTAGVATGSICIEVDTGKQYVYDEDSGQWTELATGGGGITPSGTYSISSNGTYDVTSYASASVNVAFPPAIQVDELNVTENGTYSASSGHAFGPVNVSVPTGGNLDDFIERKISGEYINNTISSIGWYAFGYCESLTSVSCNNVTSIGSEAFYGCKKLANASFPNATLIGTAAFRSCSSLHTADFPKVTTISNNGFTACVNLQTLSFPELLTLSGSFSGCTNIRYIYMPKLKSIPGYAFSGATSLSTAFFNATSNIGADAFRNCKSLMSLYLLSTSVATLNGGGAFASTPMSASSYTGTFGSIFVPSSLVASYKAATTWSAYADRITSYVE